MTHRISINLEIPKSIKMIKTHFLKQFKRYEAAVTAHVTECSVYGECDQLVWQRGDMGENDFYKGQFRN